MIASIIKALIITLAASVSVTEACALYGNCRCPMAGGVINDTITEAACTMYRKATHLDDSYSTAYRIKVVDNVAWCRQGWDRLNQQVVLSNCDFRYFCTKAGATGNDSWCKDKGGE
ncbi:hypothetical protein LY78DRAFT_659521 [Colletotrichum sublineola]|nr:hypothetical protein LY78DRAFT_659521 [Colletotrichum sublineola]